MTKNLIVMFIIEIRCVDSEMSTQGTPIIHRVTVRPTQKLPPTAETHSFVLVQERAVKGKYYMHSISLIHHILEANT